MCAHVHTLTTYLRIALFHLQSWIFIWMPLKPYKKTKRKSAYEFECQLNVPLKYQNYFSESFEYEKSTEIFPNINYYYFYCTQITHRLIIIMRNSNWNCSKWLSICLTINRQKHKLNEAQWGRNNNNNHSSESCKPFSRLDFDNEFCFSLPLSLSLSLFTNYNIYIFATLIPEALKKKRKKKRIKTFPFWWHLSKINIWIGPHPQTKIGW